MPPGREGRALRTRPRTVRSMAGARPRAGTGGSGPRPPPARSVGPSRTASATAGSCRDGSLSRSLQASGARVSVAGLRVGRTPVVLEALPQPTVVVEGSSPAGRAGLDGRTGRKRWTAPRPRSSRSTAGHRAAPSPSRAPPDPGVDARDGRRERGGFAGLVLRHPVGPATTGEYPQSSTRHAPARSAGDDRPVSRRPLGGTRRLAPSVRPPDPAGSA